MPTYPFKCECGHYAEEIRSMRNASDICTCTECGREMSRIYTAPQINMPVPPQGYFNHGLGIQVNSKHDIKEYQRKYEAETGTELIELGNERLKKKDPVKPLKPLPDEVVSHMVSEEATVTSTKAMLDKVEA